MCDFLLLHNKFWGTVRYCVTCAPPDRYIPSECLDRACLPGILQATDFFRILPVPNLCHFLASGCLNPLCFFKQMRVWVGPTQVPPCLAPRGKRCLRTRVAVQKPSGSPSWGSLGRNWCSLISFSLLLLLQCAGLAGRQCSVASEDSNLPTPPISTVSKPAVGIHEIRASGIQ